MMAPLPAGLAPAGTRPALWRIDRDRWASTWNSGIGAELTGGRWNSRGTKAVYCALDPATTILELAVHVGFMVLDTQPHTLTRAELLDTSDVHVVQPGDVPNPAWLHNGPHSAGQRAWGSALLAAHDFVVFPSVVSKQGWNIVFDPARAASKVGAASQQRFGLDTRLNLPRG